MKSVLLLTSLLAGSGLCSPVAENSRSVQASKDDWMVNLNIPRSAVPIDDLWSGSRLLKEVFKQDGSMYHAGDISATEFSSLALKQCEAETRCVGYYVSNAEDDGPAVDPIRWRIGYLFQGKPLDAKNDFGKPSDKYPYPGAKEAQAFSRA